MNAAAIATVACVLALVAVGGSVTSYDVGMAVPDAPSSFEQGLFTADWWNWAFGPMIEHGHRILGSIVGMLSFGLAIALFIGEPRRWVRWLGFAALAAVIVQGLLGRYRVVLNAMVGRELAALHGCIAHLCFAVIVALAVVTTRRWVHGPTTLSEHAGRVRLASIMLAFVVYLQIVLGAFVRHLGLGLVLHLMVAAALVAGVLWIAFIVLLDRPLRSQLGLATGSIGLLVVVQLFFGLGTLQMNGVAPPGMGAAPTHVSALVATMHQMIGSLLFALTVKLALDSRRFIEPESTGRELARSASPAFSAPFLEGAR